MNDLILVLLGNPSLNMVHSLLSEFEVGRRLSSVPIIFYVNLHVILYDGLRSW